MPICKDAKHLPAIQCITLTKLRLIIERDFKKMFTGGKGFGTVKKIIYVSEICRNLEKNFEMF